MAAPYPLILVDGSSYLFRAYHAMPKLTNSRGEPTGALIGVLNMLRKLIETYRPDYLAVVFDASGKTFRNDLYADYKAHRPPMPEDLREQIAPLHTIIETMGLPLLCVPGVEADDVIGTLATQAAESGIRTLISTGDKDMAQLVDDQVHLINTMTDALLDAAGVEEKYGVPPARIVDYLSLMGDSVDNVPGVPKCGPKTAVKWLAAHGDLDGVIANAAAIKGKVGDNLRAALDQLPLSRQLTTIKCDVALPLGPTELVPGTPDRERLREWFERIESRKLLADLDRLDPTAPAPTAPEAPQGAAADYQVVLDRDGFLDWVERLRAAPLFAFDTETTALDYMRAEIVGVSFATEPGAAAYVPLAHTCPGTPEQLDRDWVLGELKPLLEDPERAKVGQNLKYDMSVLARHGITLRGIAHDTMLESYVLDSTAGRHDMDSLAKRYLDCDTIAFEDIAGKGVKQLTFDQIPLEQAGPYAAEDAEVTLRLHRHLWPRLESEAGLAALYRDLEIPLVPILSRMERHGVRIDCEQLAAHSQDLAARIQALETQAHEVAGRPFNMGSPKQIGAILFDELGLPVVAKTPKGAPSTSESVLEQLAAEGHELPRLILEHRGLAKLRSTYTDKLPQLVDPDSGRLHTSYHQAVAATGRLSSSDPNLQNIPIRTEEGRRIRRAFVAEPGNLLIAADYSQIELRIMAHLSGDERLLAAFASGQDIHRATAAEILGIAPEAVDAEQRRSAKAVNFGLIYGMSAFGLARQLGIGRAAAQDYVDRYFERYPGVHAFMERIRAQAHEDGHVETLFGRRLHLPEIASRNQNRRAAAERTAINAPMQGSAADIIKRAMITLDDWIERERPPARMIMQVHDELVFEVAADAVEAVGARIRVAMEQAAELHVPLVVDIGVGENWQAAH
ncbi:DNA polymerase I [Marichromatium gracile]|uniref:DNA polymerase I n=1 Tax=Marichromatium gracile TaxID=1048 RepID=A0A4R4AGT8_MARGR|nr:DNA polymerase I [Marichromatium gracile]MBK1708380.1 DNA polymerase I [Marichromatium gracile]TCW38492.1 DNA polymerase I [Marichromatium gracile]